MSSCGDIIIASTVTIKNSSQAKPHVAKYLISYYIAPASKAPRGRISSSYYIHRTITKNTITEQGSS